MSFCDAVMVMIHSTYCLGGKNKHDAASFRSCNLVCVFRLLLPPLLLTCSFSSPIFDNVFEKALVPMDFLEMYATGI